MIFGRPADFAIEAYYEPYGPKWGGFGRMAIDIQGVRLGDIRENHCSLFHATEKFRNLHPGIESLWKDPFSGLSDAEIFTAVDNALYLADESDRDYWRFDFLTNTGEQFDDAKTFIVCRPSGHVHILYRIRNDAFGSRSCSALSFRSVADSYVRWFDEQVRNIAPPFFPINPFDLNETVPDSWPL
jgi:hypothetical protein